MYNDLGKKAECDRLISRWLFSYVKVDNCMTSYCSGLEIVLTFIIIIIIMPVRFGKVFIY